MPIRLSVLDQSPISEGTLPAQALHNSVDLARLADALGFHRYWVAEHHGTPMLACASPEALIGPIAALTSRIRVGSGGVMLPHYSPLKVAETFSMLSGLFPGRIDLAVGRAPGTDAATMFALQRDRRHTAPDDFPQQLDGTARVPRCVAAGEPSVRAPRGAARPSRTPRAVAARVVGSKRHLGRGARPAVCLRRFHQSRRRGVRRPLPTGVRGVGATSRSGSRRGSLGRLRGDRRGSKTARIERGRDVQAAAARPVDSGADRRTRDPVSRGRTDRSRQRRKGARSPVESGLSRTSRRRIVGSPTKVVEGIEGVARDYGADEVMIVTITYDHAATASILRADCGGVRAERRGLRHRRARASAARGTAGEPLGAIQRA